MFSDLPEEETASLFEGGDCLLHYHKSDRIPSHIFLQGLYGVAFNFQTSANSVLRGNEDYVEVDTSAGGIVTITLPKARNQLEIEIAKPFAPGTVAVAVVAPDTILNQSLTVTFTSATTSLRFKWFGTDWRII